METVVHNGVICECVPSTLSIQSFQTWTLNGALNLIKQGINLELHTPITFDCPTKEDTSLVCTKCDRNIIQRHKLKCELLDREECLRRLRGAIFLCVDTPKLTCTARDLNTGPELHSSLPITSGVSANCTEESEKDSCVQLNNNIPEVDLVIESPDTLLKKKLQSKSPGEEQFGQIRILLQSKLQPRKQTLGPLAQTSIKPSQGEYLGEDTKVG